MRRDQFGIVGLSLVFAVLWAGSGMAEVFKVYPNQEASTSFDGDGHIVDFREGTIVGDSTRGVYWRNFCGFDLSFLPPGSVVSSAVIHSNVSTVYGDPSSLGALQATRVFETSGGPSADLQAHWGVDGQSDQMENVEGELVPSAVLTVDLSSVFVGSFPTEEYSQDPGRAIVRFQFENQNNGSDIGDFLYLWDTWLELEASLPDPITQRPVGRHIMRCVPVVASLPGAAGTRWQTEMHLTGSEAGDGVVWLYFTETEQDGTSAFRVRRVEVDRKETLRWGDVLPELFGVEGTKGWIEVFSTDPRVMVNARVVNVGGEGSYGQTISQIDESKMIRQDGSRFWDFWRRQANLLMFDAENRTNVGLVNLSPGSVTVSLEVLSSDGRTLGEYDVALAPFEHRQLNRLEGLIPGVDGAGLVSLSFQVTEVTGRISRQGVAAYVSRVDNSTGDSVFIVPG